MRYLQELYLSIGGVLAYCLGINIFMIIGLVLGLVIGKRFIRAGFGDVIMGRPDRTKYKLPPEPARKVDLRDLGEPLIIKDVRTRLTRILGEDPPEGYVIEDNEWVYKPVVKEPVKDPEPEPPKRLREDLVVENL